MSIKTYPVMERFYTFQGEGVHLGRAAYFIRLYGCPLHCPWCDSAGTWHKDYVPAHIETMTPGQLLHEIMLSGTQIVVITGGEPGMFDLMPLTDALHSAGIRVHIETSGSFLLRGSFDWITVSPKWATFQSKAQSLALYANLEVADEVKIIVESTDSITDWYKVIGDCITSKQVVWLHPEWSQSKNSGVLNSITNAVKEFPIRYRAGWQMHKNYKADLLDVHSDKTLVPLGGNPDLGY